MFFRGWRSHEKVVRTGQGQRGEQERTRNAEVTGENEKKGMEEKVQQQINKF